MPTISRPAPPRLHAGSDPGLLRAHRRVEVRRHHRDGLARRRPARRSQQEGPAPHGRAAAAQGRRSTIIPKAKPRSWTPSTIPKTHRPARARSRSARCSTSSRTDFHEDPPKGYFRLAPGKEVRLRWAYFLKCNSVIKDAAGNITELHCTYDPATKGGNAPDGRKVKGTIHWVCAAHAIPAEVRLYDHLCKVAVPRRRAGGPGLHGEPESEFAGGADGDAGAEPGKDAAVGAKYQFERLGYFSVDKDSAPGKLVFNRAVTLADTWAKIEKKGK